MVKLFYCQPGLSLPWWGMEGLKAGLFKKGSLLKSTPPSTSSGSQLLYSGFCTSYIQVFFCK